MDVSVAFLIGFFTAIGWWSASKITGEIDKNFQKPKVEIVKHKDEIIQKEKNE